MSQKVFASATNFSAVTKSDTTLVTCKAIFVGTGGDIAIAPSASGSATTFAGVAAGSILPIELREGRIMSTNTTASNIVALGW